jgi:hypothetical protein
MARLRALDPESRISRILQRYPFRRADDLARVTEGLRLAGMPE